MSSSEDLIRHVQRRADIVRVRVITPHNQIEGDLHCPRVGKVGRSLSQLLNESQKRNFLALTNVLITAPEGIAIESLPFIQVNTKRIEYLYPISSSDEDLGDGVHD